MEFPREEYWSGMPCPFPEDLPTPGIKPWSPASQADSLPFELQGSPDEFYVFLFLDPLVGVSTLHGTELT